MFGVGINALRSLGPVFQFEKPLSTSCLRLKLMLDEALVI
jgi:hypothetical protein